MFYDQVDDIFFENHLRNLKNRFKEDLHIDIQNDDIQKMIDECLEERKKVIKESMIESLANKQLISYSQYLKNKKQVKKRKEAPSVNKSDGPKDQSRSQGPVSSKGSKKGHRRKTGPH